MTDRSKRPAFTLTDLLGAVTIAAILAALAIAALSDTRRTARLGEDLASLQRFASATTSYAADNADYIWGFSWQAGETYLMADENGDLVPTVMPTSHDIAASAYQATHLIRVLDDRIGENLMPIVNGWMPNPNWSHLVLIDYLSANPLARWTTSAADDVKQDWKDDPVNKFDQGFWRIQPDPIPINRRFPYMSGFEVGAASWDVFQSELAPDFNAKRIQQAAQHYLWVVPSESSVFGLTLANVAYPSAKAHMYDSHQRHFGPRVHFFGVQEGADAGPAAARAPVLTYDAAARIRPTAECNPSWRPQLPSFPCMAYYYQPASWEPPTTNDDFLQLSYGFYRWTRGGLKGIDFGALPLDTGQPDPGECDL
jgi:Tfp pilus assembly protein PilE